MAEARARDNILVRFAMFFYKHLRLTALILAILIGGGILTYTSIIKKEGFPPIQFPLSFVNGTYFVNDSAKVDADVTKPVSDALADFPGLETIQTNAGDNYFGMVLSFEESVDAVQATEEVRQIVEEVVPEQVQAQFTVVDPAAFLYKYDLLIAVYGPPQATAEELSEAASYVAEQIAREQGITEAEALEQLATGENPTTNEVATTQTNFNRIGVRDEGGELHFYPSATVGVVKAENLDILELSALVKETISSLDMSQFGDGYTVVIGADQASGIDTQINSLQSNLLGGLLAVAIVSLLLISWRASIITAIFMVSVILVSVFVLLLLGYTLNTITLFALVLALGLFVDDATIVVEAIDANRRKKQKATTIVHNALRRVAAASFAGTMTTVLVFAPLAFISGILGEFIRLLPVTVIIALVTSLLLSLTLIPLLSRFFLLRSDHVSWITRVNPVAKLEKRVGASIANVIMSLRTSKKRRIFLPLGALLLTLGMLFAAGNFAGKLNFNIFPSTKDSDQIGFSLQFAPGTDIKEAQNQVDAANEVVEEVIGEEAQRVVYGSFDSSEPNERTASAFIELTPFTQREVKSPELVDELQLALDEALPTGTAAQVIQFDAGPPNEEFAFRAQIFGEDTEQSLALAEDMQALLDGFALELPDGTTAHVTKTKIEHVEAVARKDGRKYIELLAAYDSDQTSFLVTETRDKLQSEFSPEKLSSYGLSEDDVTYDFGQESENEESFNSLTYVFPIAIGLMYVLLALQFRSFMQPLLIFLAIPFSLFGVTGGLLLTDNPMSFFAMIGLIGLIGIAVNNTILLTDYANQERRAGKGMIEAIASASEKRFRPLLATSLTTVVALLPLAMSDPFWEALAYTIIFGLLSSTFLVIVAFPYFYLGAEWLRTRSAAAVRRLRKSA